jgi:hypothetical protein
MRAADTGADRRLTNRLAIGVNYRSRDPTIAGEFSVLRKRGVQMSSRRPKVKREERISPPDLRLFEEKVTPQITRINEFNEKQCQGSVVAELDQ